MNIPLRIIPGVTALLLVCAACTQAPDPAATAPHVQVADKSDVSTEQIKHDIVGRVVKTTDAAGNGPPDEWTFEADEFKQAEILESKRGDNELSIVVHVITRNNPKPEENSIQVSGRLRLHYELKGGKWTLKTIDNLSFQYSLGVAT